jgi:hypothetical protein
MGCACKKDIPDYPGTEEWGPLLWKILHALAEKLGSSKNLIDEEREWNRLLMMTGDILPCPICKKHYKEVLTTNPIAPILKMNATDANTFLRTWLWTLHNEINVANGKPELPFADLPTLYGDVDIRDTFWRIDPVMKLAISRNALGYISWQKWIATYKMLYSYY